MLLFLVGYAGSGKSSMGRRLARRLGMRFIDTDQRVEQGAMMSVADIFAREGEEGFRVRERATIEAIVRETDEAVVSTGGGLATWRDNMEWMSGEGVTIYLRRAPEQILLRLSDYGREKRPMFRGKSDGELLEFMRHQMAEREPHYRKAAITVECTTLSDDDAVEDIVKQIDRLLYE